MFLSLVTGQGRLCVLIVAGALGMGAYPAFAQSHAAPADFSFAVAVPRGWFTGSPPHKNAVELRNPSSARVTITSLGEATHEETRERFDREVESVGLTKGQAAALQNSGTGFSDGAGGTAYAYIRWDKDERTGLISCRGKAYRLQGWGAGAEDFFSIATSLSCEQDPAAAAAAAILLSKERSAASGAPRSPGPGPSRGSAFDPSQAPPEAAEMVRTTDFDGTGVVARELRAREKISTVVGALMAIALVMAALWLSGILLVFVMRKSLGRAALLAQAHRGKCYLYGTAVIVIPTLCMIFLKLGGPFLSGFMLLMMALGSAAGCVFAAVKVFKVDAAASPLKAYHMGFGLQSSLMLVPLFGQMAFFSIITWGLGGLMLLELGEKLPDDDIPLPPVP